MAGTFPIHLATGKIMLLQCACSSGTSVQSQSLGHANGAVACCSLLFVAPSHQPKNWEEGITPIDCFPLFKRDVEWIGTVGYSWSIRRCGKMGSKASGTASVTSSVGEDFVLLLVCFAQSKEKISSIECTRKKVWFLKMSSVAHVNYLVGILSFTQFARRPRPWTN